MGLVNIGVSGLFQMMLFTSILLDMHVCRGGRHLRKCHRTNGHETR